MFTDMVGYSALSQRNEELALELLHEHREVLRAVFPKHQGQEVKSTGDGFLVEFASARAAVQCAVEIQRQMKARNAARSPERRVLVRIGIHLGDVVHREGDVFGDGVNIAARIEPLAEPGGVCVSRAVYEQIENKVEHTLVQLNRPSLKNIQATVEVYRLLLDEPRAVNTPAPTPTIRRGLVLVAAVVLVAGVGALLMVFKPRPQSNPGVPVTANPAATDAPAPAASALSRPWKIEFKVLHDIGPTNVEGVNAWGPVTLSQDGYLYACTVNQGPGRGGAILRVRTNGTDHRVLHSFDRVRDGAEPTGGVVEGRDGFLYGTTFRGGSEDAGTIFRLTKDGSDFRVLHHFASTNDCRFPQSELLEAKDGWLYGTATAGGGNALGGVFKIAKDGSGYEIVTGFFRGMSDDPRRPVGGLVQAEDGSFYGTTKFGGSKNHGTIYRLEESGRLLVVKSLGLVAGGAMQPEGTLVLAGDGALYGTSTLGGTAGGGAIFRVTPDGREFSIIHHFGTTVDDALKPDVGLVEAADGSLLGTSFSGGVAGLGAIFRVGKDGSGYQTLHSFAGGRGDGMRSRSVLTPGGPGTFYSATLNGGRLGCGVVYQLTISEFGRGTN